MSIDMDNEKVVEIIQAGLIWANWSEGQRKAFIIAGEAVKKQIPAKTIKKTRIYKNHIQRL